MNTFAELRLENEKLWGELNSLTEESEELKEKIKSLLTEEELAKAVTKNVIRLAKDKLRNAARTVMDKEIGRASCRERV